MICRRAFDSHQFAYRTGHSTEVALLKVHQDIIDAVDNKCMAALLLLHLSAALDFIDNGIFPGWLEALCMNAASSQ